MIVQWPKLKQWNQWALLKLQPMRHSDLFRRGIYKFSKIITDNASKSK